MGLGLDFAWCGWEEEIASVIDPCSRSATTYVRATIRTGRAGTPTTMAEIMARLDEATLLPAHLTQRFVPPAPYSEGSFVNGLLGRSRHAAITKPSSPLRPLLLWGRPYTLILNHIITENSICICAPYHIKISVVHYADVVISGHIGRRHALPSPQTSA